MTAYALDLTGFFGLSETTSKVVVFPLNATAFYLLWHLA
jgi:hypothetical protein